MTIEEIEVFIEEFGTAVNNFAREAIKKSDDKYNFYFEATQRYYTAKRKLIEAIKQYKEQE